MVLIIETFKNASSFKERGSINKKKFGHGHWIVDSSLIDG